MKFYTHKEHLKNIFKKDPELKDLYEKERLNYIISQQIKNIRSNKRISQFDLAKKIWTTQSVISRIESWNSNISMNTLSKLLIGLGANIKIECS